MNLQPNKQDAIVLPITNTRISASEWNQLVASCMAFITAAGLTPDAADNEQFLNAFKIIAANLELVGANTNLSNLTATGQAKFDAKANTDLSNVSANIDYVIDYKAPTAGDPSWYRVYKSGWVEQGGFISSVISNNLQSAAITLLKEMANTSYFVSLIEVKNNNQSNSEATGGHAVYSRTTTNFVISTFSWTNGRLWEVKGQGAE